MVEYRSAMRSRGNVIMARDWTPYLEHAVKDAQVMLTFERPAHAIVEVDAREGGTLRELNETELHELQRLSGTAR